MDGAKGGAGANIGCKETELTGFGRTLGSMKHIETKDTKSLAPLLCQRCGGLMRLIGSEPHPVEANTDLLTYSCTACEEFLVLPLSIPATSGIASPHLE